MIALTHIPSHRMQSGERTFVGAAVIDHSMAVSQHGAYCRLLAECGASVVTLDENIEQPDCTFVEDTAVVLDEVAIIGPMGANSRRAEQPAIEQVLREHREVERIDSPATIDGGDVLRVGRTLLVGQSSRTNPAGIAALAAIARRFDHQVKSVPVRGCLHLKTACTALPDGRLLVNRAWIDAAVLAPFELVDIPENEPWGANVALLNENVLIGAAHAKTADLIRQLGFVVRPIDLSEFAKAEGGVTCLSLLLS